MKRKYLTVRVPPEVGFRLKKAADSGGKSVSEMAAFFIESGLENRPFGGDFDQGSLAIFVENAVKIALKNEASVENSGTNFPPEVLHFLFEMVAKIHAMVGIFYKKGMTLQDSVNTDLKIDSAVKSDLEKLFKGGKS